MSDLLIDVRPAGEAQIMFVCPHHVYARAGALDIGSILRMRVDLLTCGCRPVGLVLNFWEIDDAQRTLDALVPLPGDRPQTLWRILAASITEHGAWRCPAGCRLGLRLVFRQDKTLTDFPHDDECRDKKVVGPHNWTPGRPFYAEPERMVPA